ncbi:carbohydrate ABC transporter permease [Paenibacillus sp. NPDC056579]|uniref:carbohydrate ABC transporter permease n=1 Tax=Paenibacillus sp. NPDC056579 TaxID=3345871 RepID=UPI003683A894
MNKTMRNPLTYTLFIIPTMLFYMMFFMIPLLQSLQHAFTRWDGVNQPEFNGLDNFIQAFQDELVWHSLLNNICFILFAVVVQIPVIIVLGIAISSIRRWKGLYKTTVFVPSILSTAVVGILFSFIYHPEIGLLNQLLKSAGAGSLVHTWLADDKTAMLAILVTNAWQWTGFYVVLVLAAILGISTEVYEAAELDGATGWSKAWHITIPLIRSVIMVIILLSITGAMKALDIVMVMTGGGPANQTEVLATYMIKQGTRLNEYGYGNAISILIVLFTLALTVLFQLVSKRFGEVET